jgi:hypothetical protein
MKTLSLQELFNISATHLLKQGQRAFARGGCCYRTPAGLKCAIGAVIPDDLYDPFIEGGLASWALNPETANTTGDDDILRVRKLGEVLRASGLDATHEALVGRLQRIHDYTSPEFWASSLADLATEFRLEPVPMGTGEAV